MAFSGHLAEDAQAVVERMDPELKAARPAMLERGGMKIGFLGFARSHIPPKRIPGGRPQCPRACGPPWG